MYEYDLAKRIKGARTSKGIELATVEKTEPLTLSIGGVSYSAADWTIYRPASLKLEELKVSDGTVTGLSVICSAEGANASRGTFSDAMAEKLEGVQTLTAGDLVAVYELGGQSFVILSKIERVM